MSQSIYFQVHNFETKTNPYTCISIYSHCNPFKYICISNLFKTYMVGLSNGITIQHTYINICCRVFSCELQVMCILHHILYLSLPKEAFPLITESAGSFHSSSPNVPLLQGIDRVSGVGHDYRTPPFVDQEEIYWKERVQEHDLERLIR